MNLSLPKNPIFAVLIFCLLLSACNSGSELNNEGDVLAADPQPPIRVSRIARDAGGDGVVENVTSFTYDDMNRVMITSYSYPDAPDLTTERVFTYVGNNLVMITEDDETKTFSYENERLILIEETYEDPLTFVYDDAGRLTEFGGDRLAFDSDCLESEPELINTPLSYSLSYKSARVSSIIGVYGDVWTLTYRSDGRIEKLIPSGDCQGAIGVSFQYHYDTSPGEVRMSDVFDNAISDNDDSSYTFETLADGRIDTVTYTRITNRGTIYSQSSYSYNTDGLLAARTIESTNSDFLDAPLVTTVYTYTYEPFPCVRQLSTDPFHEVIGTVSASVQPAEAGLNCAYRLGY